MAAVVRQGWRACGTTGPGTTDREHAAPVAGLALPAALTAAAGPHRTPPRRAPDADHALAQDARPPRRRPDLGPGDGYALATRHAGPARRMVRTPHPPARTGPLGGTGGSPPIAWGLACRWAWEGLVVRRCPRGHGA